MSARALGAALWALTVETAIGLLAVTGCASLRSCASIWATSAGIRVEVVPKFVEFRDGPADCRLARADGSGDVTPDQLRDEGEFGAVRAIATETELAAHEVAIWAATGDQKALFAAGALIDGVLEQGRSAL